MKSGKAILLTAVRVKHRHDAIAWTMYDHKPHWDNLRSSLVIKTEREWEKKTPSLGRQKRNGAIGITAENNSQELPQPTNRPNMLYVIENTSLGTRRDTNSDTSDE